ncbi:MAG TPA: hypothetical protein VJZ27_05580 [Aggregatilineales bacterium]|nr:hypothetical protein [Aggregatilineales bacterium]
MSDGTQIEQVNGKLRLKESDSNSIRAQARAARQQFNTALDDLTINWDSLTTAQKTAAMRTMLIVLARVVKWKLL